MYHVLFCFVVAEAILLLITCIPKFRNLSPKTRKIIFFVCFCLIGYLKPEQYFLKFKSMDKALSYYSVTKTDYKYEGKDWGFGIYYFNSSPKLRVANKKDGKWSLANKPSTIYQQLHNHVGDFKAVKACNFNYKDCVVVIWPLDKSNEEKIMTDSSGNPLNHIVIKETDFYYAKNINHKTPYTVYYNDGAIVIG